MGMHWRCMSGVKTRMNVMMQRVHKARTHVARMHVIVQDTEDRVMRVLHMAGISLLKNPYRKVVKSLYLMGLSIGSKDKCVINKKVLHLIKSVIIMSLLFQQWLPENEKHALTVKDIRRMKAGESIDLAIFDRNVGDAIDLAVKEKRLKLNKAYSFGNLIKRINQVGTYTHGEGLKGTLKMGEVIMTDFSFDVLDNKKKVWKPIGDRNDVRSTRILGYRGYALPLNRLNLKEKVKTQVNALDPFASFM